LSSPKSANASSRCGSVAAHRHSVGKEITIRGLAEMIADVVGFRLRLVLDASKSNETPRMLFDASRLKTLGWPATIPLRIGFERQEGATDRAAA
jgi:nucleoside-diphosphate-sugar epimerase